jgi:hypothetical protein
MVGAKNFPLLAHISLIVFSLAILQYSIFASQTSLLLPKNIFSIFI